MTHKKKAPMWARLKASKRALKSLWATVSRQAAELQTANYVAKQYEESYNWALAMLADVTERETRYVKQIGDYVKSNIEQKRQIEALKAQQKKPQGA
jgi:hypothetical protein